MTAPKDGIQYGTGSSNDRVKTQKSHQRKLVDCSDPTYIRGLLDLRIPPTEVDGLFRSSLCVNVEDPMKLNSLLKALGRFVPEAGSEQSTNFRWWDSRIRLPPDCRPDLNHPPTPVGGILTFTRSL
jgi:hypothetical protein